MKLIIFLIFCLVIATPLMACEDPPGESPPAESPAPPSPPGNSGSGNSGVGALGNASPASAADGDCCGDATLESFQIQINQDCDSLWEILTDPRCKDR